MLVRILFALLLLCTGPGAAAVASSATFHAAEPAPLPLGAAEEAFRGISCPSVRVCYVVGNQGSVLRTHDAGVTWQYRTRQWPSSLVAIACPAVNTCFGLAASGSLLGTMNGATTWTAVPHPPGRVLPGLVCQSVTRCDAQLFRPPSWGMLIQTSNGGRGWHIRGSLTREFGFAVPVPLACPSPAVCYAGGYNAIARSTQSGKKWTISHIGAAACAASACHEFNAIACPTQRICYAAGSYFHGTTYLAVVVATKNGFRTWTRRLIPGLGSVAGGAAPGGNHPLTPGVGALSCPTQTACVAAGRAGTIARTTDGGATWGMARLLNPSPFTTMACPTATVCFAAGKMRRLMRSDDGGLTWHDLVPAIFFSGSYSARRQLHTYSPWFTATGTWQATVGVYPELPPCAGVTGVRLFAQNKAGKRRAILVHGLLPGAGGFYSTVRFTGRLRLDVVSPHCRDFSVRIDGVQRARG